MGKTVRRSMSLETKVQGQYKDLHNPVQILKRHQQGQNILGNGRAPEYIDLDSMPDPYEALNASAKIRGVFSHLPAHVKQRFSHDPLQMCTFLADPQNKEEAIKLGLARPTKAAKAAPAAGAPQEGPGSSPAASAANPETPT